jgi:signal transduction protein with GAF and PtsI domain
VCISKAAFLDLTEKGKHKCKQLKDRKLRERKETLKRLGRRKLIRLGVLTGPTENLRQKASKITSEDDSEEPA